MWLLKRLENPFVRIGVSVLHGRAAPPGGFARYCLNAVTKLKVRAVSVSQDPGTCQSYRSWACSISSATLITLGTKTWSVLARRDLVQTSQAESSGPLLQSKIGTTEGLGSSNAKYFSIVVLAAFPRAESMCCGRGCQGVFGHVQKEPL